MIEKRSRVVIDTNVFISDSLSPDSAIARSIQVAFTTGIVLSFFETLNELKTVIARTKFNRVNTFAAREKFLSIYLDLFELVSPQVIVKACRDPKDNMILALALTGLADLIITGDADLLSLHPFRYIPILTPSDDLARSL